MIMFPIIFPLLTFSFNIPTDNNKTKTYVKASITGPYFISTCVYAYVFISNTVKKILYATNTLQFKYSKTGCL